MREGEGNNDAVFVRRRNGRKEGEKKRRRNAFFDYRAAQITISCANIRAAVG
jgi:hypothetical protein